MKILTLLVILIGTTTITYAQDNEFKLDKVYPINLTGTIKLSSDDADVTITGSDRPDVHVKIYRNIETKGFSWGASNFSVEVDAYNGNLDIHEQSTGNISVAGYIKEVYKIDIEAPRGVSLRIQGDDDDYTIRSIDGSIDLDLDDGDAEFKNCGGSEFTFNLDDGNIMMDKGSGVLYAKVDDGDIEIENASFSSINASVDDGDIIIGTSLANNGDYSFRADDSDIIFKVTNGGGQFDIDHDDSQILTSGSFKTIEEDENYTRLKIGRGTAQVKIRCDDGRIRLSN